MEHKAWHHFLTITQHKLLVMQNCFRVGLFKQGLLHDLSKYSPAEFLTGVHYYQGDRSPNAAEREEKGYSSAWLHHKGRNKHHFEYWIDFSRTSQGIAGAKMPVNTWWRWLWTALRPVRCIGEKITLMRQRGSIISANALI